MTEAGQFGGLGSGAAALNESEAEVTESIAQQNSELFHSGDSAELVHGAGGVAARRDLGELDARQLHQRKSAARQALRGLAGV